MNIKHWSHREIMDNRVSGTCKLCNGPGGLNVRRGVSSICEVCEREGGLILLHVIYPSGPQGQGDV